MKVSSFIENKDLNPHIKKLSKKQKVDALLAEYDKAQDSAQHHDTLAWNVSSLNWIGNAVLVGIVISELPKAHVFLHKFTLFFISVVGIVITMFIWEWRKIYHKIINAKYDRCKEIEKRLGMKQHTNLLYKKGKMTRMYFILMILFLCVWFPLLYFVIINLFN